MCLAFAAVVLVVAVLVFCSWCHAADGMDRHMGYK